MVYNCSYALPEWCTTSSTILYEVHPDEKLVCYSDQNLRFTYEDLLLHLNKTFDEFIIRIKLIAIA